MSGRRSFTRALGSIRGPALCAALLAGSAGAARAEGEFMRDTLSNLGLIEPDRPAITYRERAPLAMPPKLGGKEDLTAGLPVPRSRQADPAWPKDPEVLQRERAAVEAKKPIVRGAQGRMNDNNETLSVYEMDAGRRAGAGALSGPASTPGEGDTRTSTWLNPFELLKGKSETVEPTLVEPDRDTLTDPPTGYRKAPVKVAKPQGGPVGGPISDRDEADPRAYMRNPSGR
ncbi:hypothetical protein MPAR168_08910 [Methylorubrum populi]|uniref:DUF3035 domain-containing protein n=1 Tax=Methylobacterium radiotolerans TaxID=31998 RepID=A0ABU7TCT3_9HYPH|nr:hypothetical protein [Methylobacterium sp. B4]